MPFLAQNPYERDLLHAFFAVDYGDQRDINHFPVKDLPDSFKVEIKGCFGMEVSKDKKFQVLLNKCYHFVRFTRLFAELNLSKTFLQIVVQ